MTWQPGDRVYFVAQPELTGTVTRDLEGPGYWQCVVDPDDTTKGLPFLLARDSELECYTRPAEAKS
jgi:hypothetical protein